MPSVVSSQPALGRIGPFYSIDGARSGIISPYLEIAPLSGSAFQNNMILFHKSALDLVPFATPKWILSAFSMTSLDIQLRCSKHLVAPVSNMGALLGLSDVTPLLDATPLAKCQ